MPKNEEIFGKKLREKLELIEEAQKEPIRLTVKNLENLHYPRNSRHHGNKFGEAEEYLRGYKSYRSPPGHLYKMQKGFLDASSKEPLGIFYYKRYGFTDRKGKMLDLSEKEIDDLVAPAYVHAKSHGGSKRRGSKRRTTRKKQG